MIKSVFTRAPGSLATCHLTDSNETLPVSRVYPKTQKDKLVSVLFFSGGEVDHPPPSCIYLPRNAWEINKSFLPSQFVPSKTLLM